MHLHPEMPSAVRWARARFAIVASLLADPPPQGALRARLTDLAAQSWPHPITGAPVRYARSTIERWYYAVVNHQVPTERLQRRRRSDADGFRKMTPAVIDWVRQSYTDHPSWSYLLRLENLLAAHAAQPASVREQLPSYATLRRFMLRQGWRPRHAVVDRVQTDGARRARRRLETREVRSFEHTHTHALWHIDGHHGSLALSHGGEARRPVLIAVLDDHSRLICHAQWSWQEDAAAAAHVLSQAFRKRGLPRMLLSDNGGAYTAAEITQGLHRLGVLAETTLSYSPYQNGKMEVFWGQVEGRLLAMLHGQRDLDLFRLNELTLAWIEQDYHRRSHVGIATSPLDRYVTAPEVGREVPEGVMMTQVFTRRATRRQRRSDGTITVSGKRFVLSARHRHLVTVVVRYAEWDLDAVFLAHPQTDALLERLLPLDRAANADGVRNLVAAPALATPLEPSPAPPLPPLLQAALDRARSTGLPPAFLPTPHTPPSIAPPPTDTESDADPDPDSDSDTFSAPHEG